jgi:hypothetical protein
LFRAAVGAGDLPAGFAADDGAALLYAGTALSECVASRADARVLRLRPDGDGGVLDAELKVRLLPEADIGVRPSSERFAVSELRVLRAGRHRWD